MYNNNAYNIIKYGNIMIQVIKKVFNILELLKSENDMSLGELAARTEINKGTLCNILKTIQHQGYILNDGNGNYRLSPKFRQLAQPASTEKIIWEMGLHCCKKLAEETRESGVVVTMRNNQVHIVAQAQFQRSLIVCASIYENLSMYHSVSGRIMLAYLPESGVEGILKAHGMPRAEWDNINTREKLNAALAEIRRNEISIMFNPRDGIKSFAVPVYDVHGKICAGFAITVPVFRMESEEKIIKSLRKYAAQLTDKNIQLALEYKDWANTHGNQ